MEIELVRLQALHGQTEDSVDETHDCERQASQASIAQHTLSPPTSGSAKKGVSSKLKSFFANKFRKSNKDKAALQSSAQNSQNCSQNTSANVAAQDEIAIED